MTTTRPYDDEALQALVAARLVAGLGERSAELPHDVTERLRFARERALLRAREARQANASAAPAIVRVSRGGAAVVAGGPAWWQRMAAALPLVVLLFGLAFIHEINTREQVLAAADIDSVLLADDLPPAAYSDPGFAEYLRSTAP